MVNGSKGNLPVGEPETGLSLGMDMAGLLPESLDGEQWLLKVKDRNYDLKWAVAMKDKSAKSVLNALKVCISKIRLMASAANQQVVRIHANYDKSYEAEIKQYIEEQPWLRARTLKDMIVMAMQQ